MVGDRDVVFCFGDDRATAQGLNKRAEQGRTGPEKRSGPRQLMI